MASGQDQGSVSQGPEALQRFLEFQSVPTYQELAPPPIARPQTA